jgi:flagellar hook-length control protein FliK
MLARAANADAQRTGQVPAHSSPAPATTSPSDLFTRLLTVIAQQSRDGASHEGGKQPEDFAFAKSVLPTVHHTSAPSNVTPAFATAVSAASAPAAQPQQAAAVPYTMNPQSVIEQVVKGIVLRNFGTTSEVRMRLQPEHLGDVSLKLTVSGNTISANIVAQNADVRDMLVSNQQQLARSLAQAGLSLGAFSVDVSGGNPGFPQQQNQQHRPLSKAGGLHIGAVAEDEPWADSRFGPPVLSGAKPLVLNYLA